MSTTTLPANRLAYLRFPGSSAPQGRMAMRANRCCGSAAETKSVTATPVRPFARRFHNIAGWIIPAGGLVLLPKCPACLAAYIAIVTGVGISVSAATYLRVVLLTICIASIHISAQDVAAVYSR